MVLSGFRLGEASLLVKKAVKVISVLPWDIATTEHSENGQGVLNVG